MITFDSIIYKNNSMKKVYFTSAIVLFVSILFSSCMKDEITKTEVINVELKPNADYSYVISKEGDMRFTQQASHFSKSEISNASSKLVFNYKPAQDFEGSDEVKISNERVSKGGHGHCSHHQDDVTVYDFKITVKGATK
jgi:hypothetical protein